jgi:hypothetical protein
MARQSVPIDFEMRRSFWGLVELYNLFCSSIAKTNMDPLGSAVDLKS